MRVRVSSMAVLWAGGVVTVTVWTAMTEGGGASYLRTWLGEAMTVALAALLHELGHIATAWGWGISVKALRLDLFGARMELGGLMGYGSELAVAAGGPFISLVAAATAIPLGGFREGNYLFGVASLGLGLLNLLPVRGLDGGRMLYCGLALLCGERAADVTLRLTTALALGGLWLSSVYCLLRAGQTLSLFVFSLCLLLRLLAP